MQPHEYTPKAFIKALGQIDKSKSMSEKFRDFCEMAYCAYAKITAPTAERADELETRYMKIVGTYRDKDDVRQYPRLLAMVIMGVNDGLDYLGQIAGELGLLSDSQGQFFTPMSVSRMMAEMTLTDIGERIQKKGFFTLNEPASGMGSMVLAAAAVVERQGFHLQHNMLVYAADLSQLAYWCCYVQLTVRGVAAFVARENSLSMERFEGAWTIPALFFLEHHGHLDFSRAASDNDTTIVIPIPDEPPRTKQLSLFGE